LKDLAIVKANLEQILQKPLTIRATFSIILKYLKEKDSTEEFKKEILSISEIEKEIPKTETITTKEEDNQKENEQAEITEKESKEIKKEKQEKGGFLSSIFKRK
jgi:hypothetical protein